MNTTRSGLGIDLTAMIRQAMDGDTASLGNADGFRLTLLQNGEIRGWFNLASISRLTLQVTGWGEEVEKGTR